MQNAIAPTRRDVTELEATLRALIPEIRDTASREHRGHHGAAIYRAATHEATEALRVCLDDVFGPRVLP